MSLTFKSIARGILLVSLASSIMLGSLVETIPADARTLASMPQSFTPGLIADVAQMVAPSVVNIDIEKTAPRQTHPGMPFNDDILRHFFGFDPNGGGFTPYGPQVINGNGSGMIINKDGYILTNNHVVATADKMTVTLNDGRQVPAKLVGRDTFSDVAVLKIEAPNLSPVTLGDSNKLRPGEWVIAVGSPLGFDHTVTLGIVSALSRKIPDLNSNLSFIQTDAAINPGNSGGPLVNLKGEVIGINTAISGRGQNIGFAIPVNDLKSIVDTLIAGKSVERPWLGISMVGLNPELAKHVGLPPATQGVVVAQVLQNSPAYKAGLMQGDVIQKMDGKPVAKADTIQELVRSRPLNSKFNLSILRNGHPIEIGLVSEPLPAEGAIAPIRARMRVMPPPQAMLQPQYDE
jgi:serine protease Do